MSSKEQTPWTNKRPTTGGTSLLLSPPGSGFPFQDIGSSALLVPVSQNELGGTSLSNDNSAAGAVYHSEDLSSFVSGGFSKPQTSSFSVGQQQQHFLESSFSRVSPSPNAISNAALASQSPPLLPPPPSTSTFRPNTNAAFGSSQTTPYSNPYSRTAAATAVPSYVSPVNQMTTNNHASAATPAAVSSNSVPFPMAPPRPLSAGGSFPAASGLPKAVGTSYSPPPNDLVSPTTFLPPVSYSPVHPHWFYCKEVEKKQVWFPFSLLDSVHLEEEYSKLDQQDDPQNVIVATDGGRYDVYIQDRIRCAIYWDEEPMPIQRATWFYRLEGERTFLPYPEHFSDKLEEEYSVAVQTNTWHRRLEFPEGETVVIHNPQVIVHYQPASSDDWEGIPEGQVKPRVVKRGLDDFENVDDGEAMQIDHLVFVVHGIGAICDLKFRTLPEAVGDFRSIANSLLKSHFRSHVDSGSVGRIEFLPVSWHNFLHGDATGIDEKLKPITLKSIPKLRYFANDTILDVLFYTSPVFCQAIINQVSSEINRIHSLFLRRNPTFAGKVSLCGHSLGSVILFDLLYHQQALSSEKSMDTSRSSTDFRTPSPASLPESMHPPPVESTSQASADNDSNEALEVAKKAFSIEDALRRLALEEYVDIFQREKMDMETLVRKRDLNSKLQGEADLKDMGIPLGPRKKLLALQHEIKEENEKQKAPSKRPSNVSSIEQANAEVVAAGRRRKQSEATIHYMVGLAGTGHPCVIYPRLDFNPTCFFAIGSPIAMFLTIRGHDTVWEDYKLPTCPAFYNIFHPFDPVAYRVEPLIDPNFTARPILIPHHKGRKRMHLEIKESLSRVGADLKQKVVESLRVTWNTIHDFARAHRGSSSGIEPSEVDKALEDELSRRSSAIDDDLQSTISTLDTREEELIIGQLNGGRRIDYVLQEKPIESFNEYLFALGSHTCYWESEDTVLLMLKEIYSSYGIHPSMQGPEHLAKQQSNRFPVQPGFLLPKLSTASSYTSPPLADIPIQWQRPATSQNGPPQQFPQMSNSSLNLVGQHQQQQTSQINSSPFSSRLDSNPSFLTSSSSVRPESDAIGMDPTAPPTNAGHSAPPPLMGFVKQSVIRK